MLKQRLLQAMTQLSATCADTYLALYHLSHIRSCKTLRLKCFYIFFQAQNQGGILTTTAFAHIQIHLSVCLKQPLLPLEMTQLWALPQCLKQNHFSGRKKCIWFLTSLLFSALKKKKVVISKGKALFIKTWLQPSHFC